MEDKFIRDFSAPWHGEGSPRPPQALYDESVKLARQQKDDSAGSLAGSTAYQFDSSGRLLLMQAGRQHVDLSPQEQEALRLILNARPIPSSPAVIDVNTQNVVPGDNGSPNYVPQQMSRNTPPTNKQLSQRQNDLTFKWLKSKR